MIGTDAWRASIGCFYLRRWSSAYSAERDRDRGPYAVFRGCGSSGKKIVSKLAWFGLVCVFLSAQVIDLFLLRSGVEPNPGPGSPIDRSTAPGAINNPFRGMTINRTPPRSHSNSGAGPLDAYFRRNNLQNNNGSQGFQRDSAGSSVALSPERDRGLNLHERQRDGSELTPNRKRNKPPDWTPTSPSRQWRREDDNAEVTNADLKRLLLSQAADVNNHFSQLREEMGDFRDKVAQECHDLREDNNRLRMELTAVSQRMECLENYSRRLDLIFHNLKIDKHRDTLRAVKYFLKVTLKVNDVDSIPFDNCHHLYSKSKVKPVIARFALFADRQTVWHKYREWKKHVTPTNAASAVRVTEHFSPETQRKRRHLSELQEEAFREGFKCYFKSDKLVVGRDVYTWDDTEGRPVKEQEKRARQARELFDGDGINANSGLQETEQGNESSAPLSPRYNRTNTAGNNTNTRQQHFQRRGTGDRRGRNGKERTATSNTLTRGDHNTQTRPSGTSNADRQQNSELNGGHGASTTVTVTTDNNPAPNVNDPVDE